MFIVMYAIYKWWNFNLDTSTVVSIISMFVVVGGIGIVLYIVISLVIDIPEVRFFTGMMKKGANRVNGVFRNSGSVPA